MSEIRKRFLKFREEHPSLGDVIILSMSIGGMSYTPSAIRKAFDELVSKEEYDKEEKGEIINSLINYTNGRNDN